MVLKKIMLLVFSTCLSANLLAQQSFTKEQKEVQQTIISFFEAMSNKDSVGLKKNSTPDLELFETGMIWNTDSIILKTITLNTDVNFKRSNSFSFINTTISKNTAWATYNLVSEFTKTGTRGTAHWLETVIAVKDHHRWKIKVLHSTLIKRS